VGKGGEKKRKRAFVLCSGGASKRGKRAGAINLGKKRITNGEKKGRKKQSNWRKENVKSRFFAPSLKKRTAIKKEKRGDVTSAQKNLEKNAPTIPRKDHPHGLPLEKKGERKEGKKGISAMGGGLQWKKKGRPAPPSEKGAKKKEGTTRGESVQKKGGGEKQLTP